MRYTGAVLTAASMLLLSACAKEEAGKAPGSSAEVSEAQSPLSLPAEPSAGPRAVIHLKNGSKVRGSIVASSPTDMVVAGDDGIESKIPLGQVKSVEYVEAAESARETRSEPTRATNAPRGTAAAPEPSAPNLTPSTTPARAQDIVSTPSETTATYVVPAGSEVSVRMDEAINSETASAGQTFDAQVTRDVTDASGNVVIPRRSAARVVIKSASKGGRIQGASDLVLDLQSVTIGGKTYAVDTVDVTKTGKSGIGANRRTAEYTGGGAAIGAVIGAIAGGGKGAAIGAGAGAGAGAVAQVLTKGKAIKVPAESVLTFNLDKALKITQLQ